jgi:hypothetical protein
MADDPYFAWCQLRDCIDSHIRIEPPKEAGAVGKVRKGPVTKPKRQRASKRGKATVLTKAQEAVVAQIEDFKLTPQQIAEKRKCSVQAVHQLYDRARANSGYKKRRSVNLHDAKPIHANTQPKGK